MEETSNQDTNQPSAVYTGLEDMAQTTNNNINDMHSITWESDDFIAHPKGIKWYLGLYLVAIIVAIAFFLLTRDKVTAMAFVVAAIVLSIFAAKNPTRKIYTIDNLGFHISGSIIPYQNLRSFYIQPHGQKANIVLMPIKRFALMSTATYDVDNEDKILSVLGNYIPMEDHKPDLLDKILALIRF